MQGSHLSFWKITARYLPLLLLQKLLRHWLDLLSLVISKFLRAVSYKQLFRKSIVILIWKEIKDKMKAFLENWFIDKNFWENLDQEKNIPSKNSMGT